jgi:heme-degrading monooxygenase HmoA
MADEFWTIHVWTAAPGREAAMTDAWERMAALRLDGMGAGTMSLFRVSGDPRVHYTPMRWPSRDAYDAWRAGAGADGMNAVEAACSAIEVVPLETARVVER